MGLHNKGALCIALPCKGRATGAFPRSCTLAQARASVQETVMSTPFPHGHAAPPCAPQGTGASV